MSATNGTGGYITPGATRSLYDVIGPPDEETARRLVAVWAQACGDAAGRSEMRQQRTDIEAA